MSSTSPRYQSATAFRAALEARLKTTALTQAIALERLRRQVAFDRLLARLFSQIDPPWLLKGGYSMELRFPQQTGAIHARVTKDIDLTIPFPDRLDSSSSLDAIAITRERLQVAAERDLEDWFIFRIGSPLTDLDAAPYGGARFPVEVMLAGRRFVQFHLDVGLGDAVTGMPEWITGPETLGFASIPAPGIALVPRETQFAEKVHAYTLPRDGRENTRVKDLVDMMLLLTLGLPDHSQVEQAVRATFTRRRTHTIPITLHAPPTTWREPFATLAQACGLNITVDEAHTRIAEYWDTLPLSHNG